MFMTDWEAAMRKGLRMCYPGAILKGCWFHHSGSLRKKLLELGLNSILKSNANAKLIKYRMMSLPLLPPEKFDEGYAYIKSRAEALNLSTQFAQFFSYYERFWVNEVSFFYQMYVCFSKSTLIFHFLE